jgi:N-acetylglucosamine-6-phosphate deacetylase
VTTILRGATLVLPDRLLHAGTLVVEDDLVTEVREGPAPATGARGVHDLDDCVVVPGFVDVHVHGVESHDVLDAGAPVAAVAARLPRHGVTAFCPTTVACTPDALAAMCGQIRALRARPPAGAARVLPAHLESNFISPDYKGAQPLACLRLPPGAPLAAHGLPRSHRDAADPVVAAGGDFTGADIRATVAAWAGEVAIVTLAAELAGAIDLIGDLVACGHRVSLGHSGATYEQAIAGVEAGARHATHLYNRMSPMTHRAPGLVGAVLERAEIDAEIVCDGYHVHPAVLRSAVAAKTPGRIMAITDGTGGSGLPWGATASLGGRRITVREAAFLDDGTLAGSVLTMDQAFRNLVHLLGRSVVDAALMCATTPARALGLGRQGRLEAGMLADFVVLDRDLAVRETWIGGEPVFRRGQPAGGPDGSRPR